MIEIKDASTMHYEGAYMAAVIAANNMKYVHWNAVGKQFDRIHNMASDYYDKLADEMDFFAELCLQNRVPIKNPCLVCDGYEDIIFTNSEFEYRDGMLAIQTIIQNYLSFLGTLSAELASISDRYGPNATSQQSEIDAIYAYWSKELDYKLSRRIPQLPKDEDGVAVEYPE